MDIAAMDPNILLSIINMRLRDYYSSLNILCEDMELRHIKKNNKSVCKSI